MAYQNKQWYKFDITGEFSPYGDVYLDQSEIDLFNDRKKKI